MGLTDEKSNGTIALVDDSEDPVANVSNIQLQQKISSLEIKLKVSEEEKQRIKKVYLHFPKKCLNCTFWKLDKIPMFD